MTEMPAFILAFDGHKLRRFYFDNPTFDINEMAWASSMQCRFTGHVRRFYSVAEHGVLVSNLVRYLKLGDPFEALLHDAHEGYLNDIASPVKARLPDYKALEHHIETALRRSFKLPAAKNPGIKHADRIALYIEAHWLMGPDAIDQLINGDEATKKDASLLVAAFKPRCYNNDEARAVFLREYEALKP